MEREFLHDFLPAAATPFVGAAKLTAEEVEDAGLLEVLQSPGAGFGHWRILDGLLAPGPAFVFREPLGQSREVKVALSGLFGRFVARAYLTRYLDLHFYKHVSLKGVVLDGTLDLGVRRTSRGDLPDWVAAPADLSTIAVAEAKGCHDPAGPRKALDRAWAQANRVDIEINGQRLGVKRVAIVTRWGVSGGAPSTPWIAVRDPIEEGDVSDPEIEAAALVGIVRHHIADLVAPLGHADLAASLRLLATTPGDDRNAFLEEAQRHLEEAASLTERADENGDPLIGGIVTRAGPLPNPVVAREAVDMLDGLDLRPAFVGVSRSLARQAIQGDQSSIQEATKDLERPVDLAPGDISPDTRADARDRMDATGRGRQVGARVIRLTGRSVE